MHREASARREAHQPRRARRRESGLAGGPVGVDFVATTRASLPTWTVALPSALVQPSDGKTTAPVRMYSLSMDSTTRSTAHSRAAVRVEALGEKRRPDEPAGLCRREKAGGES